ncbi:hypothetical protein [Christiangramia salexigens]|uniref:Uncharacterized protein n=1 Tax=Christiangramia salexigens TaxID=1913577 RepID=A0A1L3J3Y7_9FLAO|nr:hypothetical protein [Christiangramia salexigens]APG59836.1 hypothetical protein LPB144_05135 [Christiangramia salexigens]
MKVINFEDWKRKNEKSDTHLKISKSYEDLTDNEIRLLLEKVVDRLNFSIDQLYNSYKHHKEIFEILDSITKNQNTVKKNYDALKSLTLKTNEALHSQARVIKILMDNNEKEKN